MPGYPLPWRWEGPKRPSACPLRFPSVIPVGSWASPIFPFGGQHCELPCGSLSRTCPADLVLLPITLPVISSLVASAKPESLVDSALYVESVADPPANVLRPYPDVFQQACDVLAFSATHAMFGSQAHHQVPRYFSEDETDTEAAGTDVFSYSLAGELCP